MDFTHYVYEIERNEILERPYVNYMGIMSWGQMQMWKGATSRGSQATIALYKNGFLFKQVIILSPGNL